MVVVNLRHKNWRTRQSSNDVHRKVGAQSYGSKDRLYLDDRRAAEQPNQDGRVAELIEQFGFLFVRLLRKGGVSW
jgi:hypothetical protein